MKWIYALIVLLVWVLVGVAIYFFGKVLLVLAGVAVMMFVSWELVSLWLNKDKKKRS